MAKKKEKQKRQSMMARVKKAHQKPGETKGGYGFELVGAFFCDFFYYVWQVLKWTVLTGLIPLRSAKKLPSLFPIIVAFVPSMRTPP